MNPAFRFARGGKVYKEVEADEAHQIAGYLRTGIIGANDDYWMPGMTDWKKVSTRQWDFPKPAPAPSAPATQPTRAASADAAQAQAQAAATASLAYAGRTLACECTACKRTFNEPAKAPSGYSVIGKAAMFFIIGVGLMIFVYALRDAAAEWLFRIDPKNGFLLFSFVAGLIALVALGFFLMALFELISAAVTHGLFRFNPERCPHCKSPTFVKKF